MAYYYDEDDDWEERYDDGGDIYEESFDVRDDWDDEVDAGSIFLFENASGLHYLPTIPGRNQISPSANSASATVPEVPVSPSVEPLKALLGSDVNAAAPKRKVTFDLKPVDLLRQATTPVKVHIEKKQTSTTNNAVHLSTKLQQSPTSASGSRKAKRRGNGDILGVLDIGEWQERIPREQLKVENASKYGIVKLSYNPMLQLTEEIKNFENLKELHASGCGIRRLPAELGELKWLQKLGLLSNPLKVFPSVILSLVTLKELNLGQCDLEEIPEDIVKLEELEKLHLRGNRKLRRLTVKLFGLTKLRELNVGECSLTTLPSELSRLKQLEKLHLCGNNNLRCIPDPVFSLASLREVNAGACGLTSVPIDIEKLSKLESLLLRDNKQLRHVPPAVFRVSTLKELNVAQCGLTEISNDIEKLKMLERLHIFGNKELQTLPPSLFSLSELRELNACDCNLNDLTNIGQLKKLKILYLRGNEEIHQIPDDINALTDLRELNMGQCGLADISNGISRLSKIKILHLFGNPDIREPSNSLEALTSLEELSISECRITNMAYLPLRKFTKLRKLHMSGCSSLKSRLTEISSLTSLTELDISGCSIDTLPFATENLDELAKVSLGSNSVPTGELEKIFQLKKLEELDISNCNLTELPDVGDAGQRLKKLDVHGNLFSNLPLIALRRLEHLQELNLSQCKLSQIPDELSLLKYLILLNVSENQLSTLPSSVEKLTLLKVLNISANAGILKLPPVAILPKTLRELDISCCPVAILVDDLSELVDLEALVAQNTSLTEYPNATLHLRNLRKLDLSNRPGTDMSKNVIKDLPAKLVETALDELLLAGNPMSKPPPEIVEQGMHAIRTYLTDIIPGSQLVCAETVNMLGDTGAGKTSIVRSLRDRRPCVTDETDRTRVMDQSVVKLLNEQFVNINDFGGHDIYQTVLPMFLPPRGLGILTYDMTDPVEAQKEKVSRWITTLLAKSPGIRLVVAGTHADLRSSEECADNERAIQALVKQKFLETEEELSAHVSKLSFEMRELKRKNLPTERVAEKLRFLEEALGAIRAAEHSHVSLSCKEDSNSGLNRLHDVVSQTIKPPDPLPASWCHVMKDILHPQDSAFSASFLEWEQVEDIFSKHIPHENSEEKLKMILRYLVATSQIMWLEDHPTLGKLIFHRIDHVLALCKAVLHHDTPEYGQGKNQRLPEMFKGDAERYSRGHLSGMFLHYLLEDHSDDVAEDTMIDLMLQFNLISRVNEGGASVQYIVPSRLEDKPPDAPRPSGECRLRPNVLVRMRFFSSTMPLALFETSLASVLTWVHTNKISPVCWKNGVRFRADKVTLSYLRNGDTLEVKAAADGPRDLWKMLHPVLKTVAEHVINLWKGALPQCVLVCPGCRCCGTHSLTGERQPHFREVSIEAFTTAERFEGRMWYCDHCEHDIPRSLIFSCLPETIAPKECDDAIYFMEKLGEQCPENASDRGSASPENVLKKKFLRASSHLIDELDKSAADKIVDCLYAAGLDNASYETFQALQTRTEKVRYLVTSIIQHKSGLAAVALTSLESLDKALSDFVQLQAIP